MERLEAARPQLEQLVAEMAPDIRAGRWDVLLGDDVSGRIPTLILKRVIARSYADQGLPVPKTYFVAMGQEFSYSENDPRVQQIKDYIASGEKPKRVLFVTDNVALGGSIMTIQEAMDEIGVPSDVASVQERASLLEQQTGGRAPVSHEIAQAAFDEMGLRITDSVEREQILERLTRGHGHAASDPEARYYGVENPIRSPAQPFHLSKEKRTRSRAAVGVEKYGGPITESLRHHAGVLRNDSRVTSNHDVAELRQAATKIADELYRQFVTNDTKEGV